MSIENNIQLPSKALSLKIQMSKVCKVLPFAFIICLFLLSVSPYFFPLPPWFHISASIIFAVLSFVSPWVRQYFDHQHQKQQQLDSMCLEIVVNSNITSHIDEMSRRFADEFLSVLKDMVSFLFQHYGPGETQKNT